MPREGMLIQIDGSHHRWLGDDHPQLALHLAVDDATGKVLAACFRPDEDACGYFELIGDLISSYGFHPDLDYRSSEATALFRLQKQ